MELTDEQEADEIEKSQHGKPWRSPVGGLLLFDGSYRYRAIERARQ